MPPVFLLLIGVLILVVIVYSYLRARKVRDALRQYAWGRGLDFSPRDPFDIPKRYATFSLTRRGHSRRASNVVWGEVAGREVALFQYRYTTGSGKNQTTHHYVGCLWSLQVPLVDMAVRPESVFDRVAEWFGKNDIDFESEEFSRRFHVSGDDRREVYAVIDPRMMEYMLGSGLKHLEIHGDVAMTFEGGTYLTPERCERLLALADGFDANVPEHVVREKKERMAR